MGWLMLLILGVLAAGAMLALGVRRPMWTTVTAALVLGAAGYAWQGTPDRPGSPAAGRSTERSVDPSIIALREALFGRFDEGQAYFVMADAMLRTGEPRLAARAMLGGVARAPGSAAMWTGLGSAIAENDGNQMSPAARFAFGRACYLAPQHPGPPFFRGLARLKAGDFAGARQDWALALALSPAGASYRQPVAERLALLDRYLALIAAAQRQDRR